MQSNNLQKFIYFTNASHIIVGRISSAQIIRTVKQVWHLLNINASC